MIMMLVFYRAVSFQSWQQTFDLEFRCRFPCRSSRARTTHTPFQCPSSSSEKSCRWSLPQSARDCERLHSAAAAADLSLSFETVRAFRGRLLLLLLAERRDQ